MYEQSMSQITDPVTIHEPFHLTLLWRITGDGRPKTDNTQQAKGKSNN
jgi:hypothetical protein